MNMERMSRFRGGTRGCAREVVRQRPHGASGDVVAVAAVAVVAAIAALTRDKPAAEQ